MSTLLRQVREHGSLAPFGQKGDDEFPFNIPPNEIFDDAHLTIQFTRLNAGVSLASQPAAGQTGAAKVVVHWWYDGCSDVKYEVEAHSKSRLPQSRTAKTRFLPSRCGFHFNNSFLPRPDLILNSPFGAIGIGDASKGLCGGMVLAALDYFQAGVAIPADTTPPNGGPLFDFIVRRLFDSFNLPAGVVKYMDLMNPLLPDHETDMSKAGLAPHGRAWRMIREEWPPIKADLDAGRPSPISLIRVKTADFTQLGQNHQVMAYDYDLSGNDLQLYIYDPNSCNDDSVRMQLNIGDPEHTTPVTYSNGGPVYCFFHTPYAFAVPPTLLTPGRVLLFEDADFGGRFKDVRNGDPDLTATDGGFFNDRVSSLVVLSGNWAFYRDVRFGVPYLHAGKPVVLGPGLYRLVGDVGIQNDDLSSLKAVTDPPNH
jgi:hypothetical protein